VLRRFCGLGRTSQGQLSVVDRDRERQHLRIIATMYAGHDVGLSAPRVYA
jgi:hypothetical protein